MNRIEGIKQRLKENEGQFHKNKIEMDEDVEYLLEQVEILRNAAHAARKHLDGTAVIFSHRTKEAVLSRLNKALEPYAIEEERGGLVRPDGGDYPLKWLGDPNR